MMTEREIKEMCKWVIDNSNQPLTITEKEIIKKAIDNAKSFNELLGVALTKEFLIFNR
jgi:hypothetical protein